MSENLEGPKPEEKIKTEALGGKPEKKIDLEGLGKNLKKIKPLQLGPESIVDQKSLDNLLNLLKKEKEPIKDKEQEK